MAFTARGIAERLVQIQKLESVRRAMIIAMRRDAVKTTADTLWRRYKTYLKRDSFEKVTFIEWLDNEHFMENTFWHGTGAGLSLGTRRKMAIRYLNFFYRKELYLEKPEDVYTGAWARTALEAALNMKQPSMTWMIVVDEEPREAIPSQGLRSGGDTFTFFKKKREDDEQPWQEMLEDALHEVWPQ